MRKCERLPGRLSEVSSGLWPARNDDRLKTRVLFFIFLSTVSALLLCRRDKTNPEPALCNRLAKRASSSQLQTTLQLGGNNLMRKLEYFLKSHFQQYFVEFVDLSLICSNIIRSGRTMKFMTAFIILLLLTETTPF